MVSLSQIDALWVEHLRQMDDLRHAVQTAVYEQKDPLVVYKLEAFKLFKDLLDRLAQQILGTLFRIEIFEEHMANQRQTHRRQDFSRLQARQAGEDYYFTQTTTASAPAPAALLEAEGEAVPYTPPSQPDAPLSRRERRAMQRQQKKKRS
jgi:preprotein translocase subunit SecA